MPPSPSISAESIRELLGGGGQSPGVYWGEQQAQSRGRGGSEMGPPAIGTASSRETGTEQEVSPMPGAAVPPPKKKTYAPNDMCGSFSGPGWGAPLQREPQRGWGRQTPPPCPVPAHQPSPAPAGASGGALSCHCRPQPQLAPVRGQRDPLEQALMGWGGGGGRSRAGRWLLLAEDETLVVGRHVHLEVQN